MKCEKFIELAKATLKQPPLLIFDLGSFDASQAVELSDAFPCVDVIAVEADPFNFVKCLDRAKGHPRVRVINAAIGQKDGLVTFYRAVGQNDQCGSLLMPNNRYPQAMPVEPIYVAGLSPTSLMRQVGVPDLLWMDMQGTELDFFAGHFVRPKMVWLEVAYQTYYQGQPLKEEVLAFMKCVGYSPIFEAEGIRDWFGDICFAHHDQS